MVIKVRIFKFRAYEKSAPDNLKWWSWEEIQECANDLFDNPKCKAMQYTGLNDKNDKEIYEGDIVQGRYRGYEMQNVPQKVTFLNGCFMFGNWNAHEYFNRHQEIEVIGNIYENLELLNLKLE